MTLDQETLDHSLLLLQLEGHCLHQPIEGVYWIQAQEEHLLQELEAHHPWNLPSIEVRFSTLPHQRKGHLHRQTKAMTHTKHLHEHQELPRQGNWKDRHWDTPKSSSSLTHWRSRSVSTKIWSELNKTSQLEQISTQLMLLIYLTHWREVILTSMTLEIHSISSESSQITMNWIFLSRNTTPTMTENGDTLNSWMPSYLKSMSTQI